MNTAVKNRNLMKVITGKDTVMAYLNVNAPKAAPVGGEPKYSVCLLIPKTDEITLRKIQIAIRAAYDEGREKLKDSSGNVPSLEELKTPLRDGDVEHPEIDHYRNHWFLNATSKTKPEVVDGNLRPVVNSWELYSGIVGRASLGFYAYSVRGNRGIACGLNNLQKLKDAKPLGSRRSAADDFAGLEEDDDF